MLREFDLQRMHWADKTQSMLHQRQMEACEARLLSYPTESIFTLQDERETECWWQCACDAEESPKSPVLHTLREMRANVLARLPVEAALLTETEHALIGRLILCGGQARIDGWQELSAAESLLRRLWCTLEVDEQDVLLHLPPELMTPLSLILREQRHQDARVPAAAGAIFDHRLAGRDAEEAERFGGMAIAVAREIRLGPARRPDRRRDRSIRMEIRLRRRHRARRGRAGRGGEEPEGEEGGRAEASGGHGLSPVRLRSVSRAHGRAASAAQPAESHGGGRAEPSSGA